MKKLSKLNAFGLAFLMSLFTLTLSGQGGQGTGGGPGQGRGFQMSEDDITERVDNLSETLKFSKEQHKKILEYELEFYNKTIYKIRDIKAYDSTNFFNYPTYRSFGNGSYYYSENSSFS